MKLVDPKTSTLELLKKKAALTKGMAEFVIKIDMNLDAPIVNTGCVIPVNNGKFEQLWVVINMEEFGPFIEAEKLAKIQEALVKHTKKSFESISTICHTAVCIPLVPTVDMTMLKTSDVGNLILAVHLMNGYLKNKFNRLHGRDINYCHFASRCHVYFNNYPAGLKAGTDIEMAGDKFTPHMLSRLKPENKVYLVDLIPSRRELELVTGTKQKFIARTESFAFPEAHQLKMSELAATVTHFIATFEKQCQQIVDATTKSEQPKKSTKKTTRKKAK